jgi:glycosyltransferase involved in cell wall biosynthesis
MGDPPLRLLWAKVGPLWPPDSGGRLRSLNLLAELSRGHQVTVLMTHGPGDADVGALAARLPMAERVVSLPHVIAKRGSARFAAALARSWTSPLPVDLAKFRAPALRGEIARIVAAGEVDVCVADFLSVTPNVELGGAVPVLFFAHNVEHMIWRRLRDVERRPWRRAALEIEWRKMRRWEAHVVRRAGLTVAVSDVDAERLAALAPGARVCAVPTGVDTDYFAPGGAAEKAGRIVFTGSMDWHPNEDGALHFLDAVLPRVCAAAPEASFVLVGRNPSPRLRAAAEAAGALVTGTVDDVRPFLAEAALCVVPLRVGGGTRLKIFEALAMGKAVVSTTIGAEGLPLTPDHDFVQRDDPAGFASAVVALLRDPARRAALGRAGRRLVEERYGWRHVARAFERRCHEAKENHHHAR